MAESKRSIADAFSNVVSFDTKLSDSLKFESYTPPAVDLPVFDETFEPRTLEDDEAFMRLLSEMEESNRMASASDRRSRKSLAVGVATALIAFATLLVALFGSPFTTSSGSSASMPSSASASEVTST